MNHRHAQPGRARRSGFTLVELLVVVVIIVLVIGIIIISGANVIGATRHAATERLLTSVSNAVEQFHADHGFYPPLLTHRAGPTLHVADVQPNAFDKGMNDPVLRARYHSVYSLGAYLIGIGDLRGDGDDVYAPDPNLDDGHDGPGFRSPGPDRAWGGALDGLSETNDLYQPPTTGRVYGPYIDVKPGRAMRQVEQRSPIRTDVVQDGVGAADVNAFRRYTLVDRWGNPIRYYSGWPTRDKATGEYTLLGTPAELLSRDAVDVFAAETSSTANPVPPQGDGLFDAPYALLSAGEDGYFGESRTERGNAAYPSGALFINAGTLGAGLGVFGTDETELSEQDRFVRRIRDNIRVTP